jgi:hypothetical protein
VDVKREYTLKFNEYFSRVDMERAQPEKPFPNCAQAPFAPSGKEAKPDWLRHCHR